jgi:hypothetical protein
MLGVFAEFEREIIKDRSKHRGRIPAWLCLFLAPIGSMSTIEMDRRLKIWINATALVFGHQTRIF